MYLQPQVFSDDFLICFPRQSAFHVFHLTCLSEDTLFHHNLLQYKYIFLYIELFFHIKEICRQWVLTYICQSFKLLIFLFNRQEIFSLLVICFWFVTLFLRSSEKERVTKRRKNISTVDQLRHIWLKDFVGSNNSSFQLELETDLALSLSCFYLYLLRKVWPNKTVIY